MARYRYRCLQRSSEIESEQSLGSLPPLFLPDMLADLRSGESHGYRVEVICNPRCDWYLIDPRGLALHVNVTPGMAVSKGEIGLLLYRREEAPRIGLLFTTTRRTVQDYRADIHRMLAVTLADKARETAPELQPWHLETVRVALGSDLADLLAPTDLVREFVRELAVGCGLLTDPPPVPV
jgi:hypothetical protein